MSRKLAQPQKLFSIWLCQYLKRFLNLAAQLPPSPSAETHINWLEIGFFVLCL